MQVWAVTLLLNFTLAAGLGLGYAAWGRRAEALDREFDAARAQLERLQREQQACAGSARAGAQQWDGRGLVRAVYSHMLVITHEDIPGLLPPRTTSFRTTSSTLRDSVRVGDAIRFSLQGTLVDDVVLVATEPW